MKTTAVYLRVSTNAQKIENQEPDLRAWLKRENAQDVKWYTDHFTGKVLDRPGMNALLADVRAGQVDRIVVWRIDRLARRAYEFCQLLDELNTLDVRLVSVREGIDFSTPVGKLMAQIASAFAEYELENKQERHRAGLERCRKLVGTVLRMADEGQDVNTISIATRTPAKTVKKIIARKGKLWWGAGGQKKKGTENAEELQGMLDKGYRIAHIAQLKGVSRITIWRRVRALGLKTGRKPRNDFPPPETPSEGRSSILSHV